ncbi:DRTGG domain-containing protein [Staphylococcus arlettae]|uniref:DRTGG domain-containing protein n=1 Tax=Staphylococcus arlettae TaxID=29378 RepID=UPI000DCC9F89|nr:DRTGG domain-containing protein [Staphylococcus arlettae]RBA02812.1 Cobalt-dependent inorganic pyrophosphatase [Staphylococcus arlettae]RBA03311.1 Cobalt-dependent inorganic pyrophosphatase [Staphylococcus arlettae]RBA07788.1 Cobalt-dependent inorganic pyrophosphatase [Staphylococcus arlettae]
MTKHEQILSYIESLSVGQKISVRKIAKDLEVSEGTAYRAIKDAGQIGLVATIDRVGTVRIEKKNREEIEQLTFSEIVKIIDGQVLGGRNGLIKTLTKFAIGAMELNDVVKYLSPHTLLIVGNRKDVQLEALKRGSAVLITGGFTTTNDIIKYADEHDIPIISSNYDSYLVANIINRAMYNQMIRKEILVVNDIVKPIDDTTVLFDDMTLTEYKIKAQATGHSRFPIIDEEWKLVGIVTSKEIINMQDEDTLATFMTKSPINVQLSTTIANCAHIMIWEGIELLPVTTISKKLIGVITREDVLKSMQLIGRQPQVGETINDQIAKHITISNDIIQVTTTPLLTDQFGMLSKAVFVAIIEETVRYEMRKYKKIEVMIESLNIFYIKTVQIESEIDVHYDMLDVGRNFAKLEVTMKNGAQNVAKAMIMCQIID